jgi:hypothetical protein
MSLVAPIMLAIFVVTVELLLAISLMEAFRHIPMPDGPRKALEFDGQAAGCRM